MLGRIDEVKIIQTGRVKNAKADTLAGLAASLSIQEGKTRSIVVTGRRLLTPLLEALPRCEKVCCVEIDAEATEDWRLISNFSKTWRTPLRAIQKGRSKRRATKSFVLKGMLYGNHWMHTPSMLHELRDAHSHEWSPFRYMQSPTVWIKASYTTQNVGILLAYQDWRLHGFTKRCQV